MSVHTYHINTRSALLTLCVQVHLDNSIFDRRVGSITPSHYTTPLESISRRNNKRAVNNQKQQEEANTTKITLEIIYLDYPQTNSTNTTIDVVTPGTQGNIDQPCNVDQTNSLSQPTNIESPNSNNSYTHNDFIPIDQPSDPTQATNQAATETTQDTTSNQATPPHTTESSIVTVYATPPNSQPAANFGPKRGRLKINQFHPSNWNLKRGE